MADQFLAAVLHVRDDSRTLHEGVGFGAGECQERFRRSTPGTNAIMQSNRMKSEIERRHVKNICKFRPWFRL